MKIATIEVEDCGQCPHVYHGRPSVCMASGGPLGHELQDTAEIPDWCPLSDAPKEMGAGA